MSALRGPALAVALAVAYVAASHWLMTHATTSAWAALVILAPSLVAIAAYGWRVRTRSLVVACAIACVGLFGYAMRAGPAVDGALHGGLATAAAGNGAALAAASLGASTPLLYLLQHVAIHGALGLVFAVTLRRGATPLVSALATRVHGALVPAMARYTRHVTEAWVAYFAAMALLSLLLYALVSFDTWAVFANLVTPLAVAAMFIGEHALRYRLHPEFERASLRDAIAAYRAHGDARRERERGGGGGAARERPPEREHRP